MSIWKCGNLEMWKCGAGFHIPDFHISTLQDSASARCWINGTGFQKTLGSQPAAVAAAAWPPVRPRIVTTQREPVVQTERDTAADNLGLRELDERREDAQGPPLDARPGGQRGEPFERLQEFRTAIRISGVIERVHANHDRLRAAHLRERHREREEYGVPRGDVGRRNGAFVERPIFRNRAVADERGAAELRQRYVDLHVSSSTERLRDLPRRVDLPRVDLSVADCERVELVALCSG